MSDRSSPKPTPMKPLSAPEKVQEKKQAPLIDFKNPVLSPDDAARIKKVLGL